MFGLSVLQEMAHHFFSLAIGRFKPHLFMVLMVKIEKFAVQFAHGRRRPRDFNSRLELVIEQWLPPTRQVTRTRTWLEVHRP